MKNGDKLRTSSCAANSRPSLPTVKVTIGEVRVLPTGGLRSNDLCNFDNFAGSLDGFFNFTTFSIRSLVRWEYDRLNMIAVLGWCIDVEEGIGMVGI
jgi:hypothetical protein